MTVGQLIQRLSKYPKSHIVVIQDEHEDVVYPIVDIDEVNNSYDPHSLTYGISSLSPDLHDLGYTDSHVVKGKKCVILQTNYM